MAILRRSILAAISGKVGSLEFATTSKGIVVKKRKPCRPMDSPRELNAQSEFHLVVSHWNNLDDVDVLAWNKWAECHPVTNRLGKTIYLSGYNWFLKLRSLPPPPPPPIEITLPIVVGDPRVYENGPYYFPVTWPDGAEDDSTIKVWFGTGHHNSDLAWPRDWKFGGSFTKGTFPVNYHDVAAGYGIAFYGQFRYWLDFVIERPGRWWSQHVYKVFGVLPVADQVVWLMMDDCNASPQVVDQEYQHNQTFEGTMPNTNAHSCRGVHLRALHFDGSTNKITLTEETYQPYLLEYTDFTMCLWWKPDTPMSAGYKGFASNYSLLKASLRFAMKNSKSVINFAFLFGGSLHYTSCEWDEDDVSEWRHFAVVRDGAYIRCYRNGVKGFDATESYFNGRLYDASKPFTIGCDAGSANFFAGAVDNFHIYDRALTDVEIAELAVP